MICVQPRQYTKFAKGMYAFRSLKYKQNNYLVQITHSTLNNIYLFSWFKIFSALDTIMFIYIQHKWFIIKILSYFNLRIYTISPKSTKLLEYKI